MCAFDTLDAARRNASRYRIRKSERGYHLWRFYGWQSDTCGWRVIVADLKTREDAALCIARRLGLTDKPAPEPHEPIMATVSWGDAEWM